MSEFRIKLFFIVLYTYLYMGLIPIVAPASKELLSYLLICCDLSLISLGLMFINKPGNRFIGNLFLVFIVTSTITYGVNSEVSIISHINGLREYLIIFSAYSFTNEIFASEYRDLFLKKFYGYIKPFLIIQIPVTIYQFSKYGATDWVGGTFGPGGTGTLTIIIFILCFYLIWIHTNRQLSGRLNYRLYLVILPFFLPILLNETKVSFVFLALFFLFQLKLKTKALVSNIMLLIVAIVFFNIYNNYVASGGTSDVVIERDFYEKYLFKDYEEEDVDIARFTKISIALETLSQDSLKLFFGNGIGIFKGGRLLKQSEFTVKYSWLLSGSRPYLFFLLIQGGLINTALILTLIFYPLIRNYKNKFVQNAKPQLMNNLRYFVFATLVVILFYNDSLRNGALVMVISSISMIVFHHRMYNQYNCEGSQDKTHKYSYMSGYNSMSV